MFPLYSLLSFLSGIALTLQVGINGQLREKAGSPVLSSFISFAVGALSLAVVFCFSLSSGTYSWSDGNGLKEIRWWMLTGGLFGAFYIFTTIFASPKIGFANMFSLVICGQILLAVLFDHFGILGNSAHTINPYRILGVILLVLGVYIIQKH